AGVALLLIAATVGLGGGEHGGQPVYLLIAGAALIIASVAIDPRWPREVWGTRQARFGSLSVFVTAVLLGILVAVNVAASRSSASADLTRAGLYTLSPQSVHTVQQLRSDLTITGFYRPDQASDERQMQDLLARYESASPRVKVRFLDADANAALARQYGVDIAGSVVLQYESRKPVVLTLASQSEADVTGAIARLVTNRTPVLCWAQGDGERSLGDGDQTNGYSTAQGVLQSSNYQVQGYLLSQEPRVPSSCSVVAVVGPTNPISGTGRAALQAYVDGGGRLLLAFDPWVSRDGAALRSVNTLLQPYGVGFDGGLVVEGDTSRSATNDPSTPVAVDFGDSPIGQGLAGRYVYFPHPTPIVGDGGGQLYQTKIASTSSSSYRIAQPRQQLQRQDGDQGGSFPLLETLEAGQSAAGPRLVLVGTSGFADNQVMPPNGAGANQDLLLSSLDWLTNQEGLIGIAPKPNQAQPLQVTGADVRLNYLVTLVVIPGLILLLGAGVFLRRRGLVRRV
ncbi:MAG: GldG family protein, partial [Candidatus Dormibacteraeota bacterium]|nr:GldG family protein [Candidatus Dormibacteraeota bacterium]